MAEWHFNRENDIPGLLKNSRCPEAGWAEQVPGKWQAM